MFVVPAPNYKYYYGYLIIKILYDIVNSMAEILKTFLDLYNVIAAIVILYMIFQILIMLKSIDKSLLKARIFLKQDMIEKTWMFMAIAGASFALHALIDFLEEIFLINTLRLNDVTQIIFLIAFILAVYQWYFFVGHIHKKAEIA